MTTTPSRRVIITLKKMSYCKIQAAGQGENPEIANNEEGNMQQDRSQVKTKEPARK